MPISQIRPLTAHQAANGRCPMAWTNVRSYRWLHGTTWPLKPKDVSVLLPPEA